MDNKVNVGNLLVLAERLKLAEDTLTMIMKDREIRHNLPTEIRESIDAWHTTKIASNHITWQHFL